MKYTHRELKNVIRQVAPALLASLAVAATAYGVFNPEVDLSTLMANPQFNLPNQPTAPGNQVGCPTGWTCGGSPAPGGTAYVPTAAQYPGGVPGGVLSVGQCPTLVAGSCELYQLNLGKYAANTMYTVPLWVGTPLTVPICGNVPGCTPGVTPAGKVARVTAYWLGNGNAQLQATNIPVPAPGVWQLVPLFFTPTGSQVGQTINFLIFASTGAGYEIVNFFILPPPPPLPPI